jgi:hypothetical protein
MWHVQELEHQLVAAAEEKTKVQSKFHELSIKHRQLIETSPQVGPLRSKPIRSTACHSMARQIACFNLEKVCLHPQHVFLPVQLHACRQSALRCPVGAFPSQVATIWNEVLVQQAADGHNAAAMQRLVNFDLRHTTANSTVNKPVPSADSVSVQQLPGISAAAAVYSNSSGPPPGGLCLGIVVAVYWCTRKAACNCAAGVACHAKAGSLAWL